MKQDPELIQWGNDALFEIEALERQLKSQGWLQCKKCETWCETTLELDLHDCDYEN